MFKTRLDRNYFVKLDKRKKLIPITYDPMFIELFINEKNKYYIDRLVASVLDLDIKPNTGEIIYTNTKLRPLEYMCHFGMIGIFPLIENQMRSMSLVLTTKIPKEKKRTTTGMSMRTGEIIEDYESQLRMLSKYRELYYKKNARDEETIWLTALTSETFTELYDIISNILKDEYLEDFMARVVRLNNDKEMKKNWNEVIKNNKIYIKATI